MKVLIDTNVLISAMWRDRKPESVILWVISHPNWQWIVSAEIMQEYKGVLRRKKFSFSAEILQKWERLLDQDTHPVSVNADVNFPRDQKDAKFLACALSNNADFFITGDGDFEEAYRILDTTVISVSIFHQTIIGG